MSTLYKALDTYPCIHQQRTRPKTSFEHLTEEVQEGHRQDWEAPPSPVPKESTQAAKLAVDPVKEDAPPPKVLITPEVKRPNYPDKGQG